ncbi:MAG: helix-turn-helix transcriptional regulator [Paracoccaceae bacterium]
MPKSDRFFEIIQLLRGAKAPLPAQTLADTLEVSVRTIYRDIATLQARQTPIEGAPGLGYVMRKGYDLPPLNLDAEEAEARAVGLSMIARTGDAGLWRAAQQAFRKLNEVAPGTRRLITSSCGINALPQVDLSLVRGAIREERKLRLHYRDVDGKGTDRVIWPLALIYYSDTAIVAGWCELRQDLRHFRLDRILACSPEAGQFKGRGEALLDLWETSQKDLTVTTRVL